MYLSVLFLWFYHSLPYLAILENDLRGQISAWEIAFSSQPWGARGDREKPGFSKKTGVMVNVRRRSSDT